LARTYVEKTFHLEKPKRAKKRKKERVMSALATAISNRQWELAALYLLLGLMEAFSRLPADSVEGLLDVLEGESGKE
jgi:hypothetical protein